MDEAEEEEKTHESDNNPFQSAQKPPRAQQVPLTIPSTSLENQIQDNGEAPVQQLYEKFMQIEFENFENDEDNERVAENKDI